MLAFHRLTAPGRRLFSCASASAQAPQGGRDVLDGVRRELVHNARRGAHREGRGDPDVLQVTVVVVEAEQQRPHDSAGLVPPVAGDHAVGGALVLDLEHRPRTSGW